MSRRTEDDDARDLLADLNNRGFRICESIPKADAHYLEGKDVKEWAPIDDKRAARLLATMMLVVSKVLELEKLVDRAASMLEVRTDREQRLEWARTLRTDKESL